MLKCPDEFWIFFSCKWFGGWFVGCFWFFMGCFCECDFFIGEVYGCVWTIFFDGLKFLSLLIFLMIVRFWSILNVYNFMYVDLMIFFEVDCLLFGNTDYCPQKLTITMSIELRRSRAIFFLFSLLFSCKKIILF